MRFPFFHSHFSVVLAFAAVTLISLSGCNDYLQDLGNATNNQKPADNRDGGPDAGGGQDGGQKDQTNTERDPSNNPENPNTDHPDTALEVPVPQITVLESEDHITAGEAVHVHALQSDLKSGDVLTAHFEWDFGDSASDNEGYKRNHLEGWQGAHLYENAGTYTITLKITNDEGQAAQVQKQITVDADDRTSIYVSSTEGKDNNSGTSTDAPTTVSKLLTLSNYSHQKILFKRGDTFHIPQTLALGDSSDVLVSAYGSGANPNLLSDTQQDYEAMISSGYNAHRIVIRNLTFDKGTTQRTAVQVGGHNVTIKDCEFKSLIYGMNLNWNPMGVLIQGNHSPTGADIEEAFTWLQGTDVVFLNNTISNTGLFTVRGNADRVVVEYNDWENTSRNTCRLEYGQYFYVSQNTFRGMTVLFGPLPYIPEGGAAGPEALTQFSHWAVYERNDFKPTGGVFNVRHGQNDLMVRNNVFEMTDHTINMINVEGWNDVHQRNPTDIRFLNNTITNPGTGGGSIWAGSFHTAEIDYVNNLYFAPHQVAGTDCCSSYALVPQANMGSIRSLGNNVWESIQTASWMQSGLVFLLGGNFVSLADWNEARPTLGNLDNDISEGALSPSVLTGIVAPPPSSQAARYGKAAKGIFNDYYGNPRPASQLSAGAVQISN